MRIGFFACLRAHMKRAGRLLVFVMLIGVLLFAAASAIAAASRASRENDRSTVKLRIGLAGEENNSYMKLAEMVLLNDPITSSAEIVRVSAKDAEQLIRQGELNACIVLPEGFFDAIGVGEHKEIRFIGSPVETGIGQALMRDFVSSASEIILACENSIYGVQKFIYDHDLPADPVDEANALILDYFLRFADRGMIVKTELSQGTGGEDARSDQVAISVFLMMIVGTAALPLYLADRTPLRKMLLFSGLSYTRQALAEWLTHCVVCTAVAVLSTVGIFVGQALFSGVDISGILPDDPLGALFRAAFCAAVFSALSYFFYTAAGRGAGALLPHALFALTVGYFSGCFYPVAFFSAQAGRAFSYLPAALAIGFISRFDATSFILLFLYGCLFFGLSLFFVSKPAKEGGV